MVWLAQYCTIQELCDFKKYNENENENKNKKECNEWYGNEAYTMFQIPGYNSSDIGNIINILIKLNNLLLK